MNQGIGNRPLVCTACETCGGKLGSNAIVHDLGIFCRNTCLMEASSRAAMGDALDRARGKLPLKPKDRT